MKVVWSEQARDELRQTSNYILRKFGKKSRQNFLQEVGRIATLLETNPNIGPVETLLENAPVLYRNIVVNRLNKMVYYINDEKVEIVALWDTRREPKSLQNSILNGQQNN